MAMVSLTVKITAPKILRSSRKEFAAVVRRMSTRILTAPSIVRMNVRLMWPRQKQVFAAVSAPMWTQIKTESLIATISAQMIA